MNQAASQKRREKVGEKAGGRDGWGADSEGDNREDSMTKYGAI